MNLNELLPMLRDIEAIPLEEGDEASFLLRDPLQLSERSLTVSPPVLFCLQFFDGRSQVATLAEAWHEASEGQELPLDQLQAIIEEMDAAYLLDNDHSRQRLLEVRAAFLTSDLRTMRQPIKAGDLTEMLNECYAKAELPLPAQIKNESNDMALLVAPHIDYIRGGAAYGLAYGQVCRHFSGDVALILGTNHQYHEKPLALTRKSFETPLGTVYTDTALVEELAEALPFDAYADEFSHRDEHSVYLAATALKHALGDRCPAIVPVLCGSFEEFLAVGMNPNENELVQTVQNVLRRIVEREGERLLVVASVDFAHIGPQFGDPQAIDEVRMRDCLELDKQMLEAVATHDVDRFLDSLIAERNRRHVCGVSPLYYAMQSTMEGESLGSSLHAWQAGEGAGAVTFGVTAMARAKD